MKGAFHCLHRGGSLPWKSEGAWALREAEMDKVEEEWMEERAERAEWRKGRDRWSGG